MTVRPTSFVAPLAVGVVAFVATWSALLPGVAFWDTGELQVVAPVMGTAHPTGFPTYVLLGLARQPAPDARSASRPSG